MRSVSSLLARCWARHAISRSDARVKKEQRAARSGLNLSRCPEEKRRGSIERERERETDREKEQTHPPGMQVGG